jgi:nicotinate phosphoribosyltransferase
MDRPIITSLLDTDFYKFLMANVIFHKYPIPTYKVEYSFKLRNSDRINLIPYVGEINRQIDNLCSLTFTECELDWLSTIFDKEFIGYLKYFRLNREHISIRGMYGDDLGYHIGNPFSITVCGPWIQTIFFEIFILSIVNEVVSRDYLKRNLVQNGALKVLTDKLNLIKDIPDFKFSDFGTRRRFSKEWQEQVIGKILQVCPNNFIGTSNVMLAKEYNINYVGTVAHEFTMCHQEITNLRHSQIESLHLWKDHYKGKYAIALTDTYGIDAFLKDFDYSLSMYYNGVRHDSGDPFIWTDKILKHYNNFGIDSKSKTAIYSDSLTFPKATEILNYNRGKIKTIFGIGTNLTNDVPGYEPLNVVMKPIRVNGNSVCKISDSKGKEMCDDLKYIQKVKYTFNIKEQ